MILDYFTFVQALKISRINKMFLILSICTLIDLIVSILLWVDDFFILSANYERFAFLRIVSVVFFVIFVFKYYPTAKMKDKLNKIYIYIMVALIAVCFIAGGIGMCGRIPFIMNLSDISYWSYVLVRLLFVFHQKIENTGGTV